MDTTTIINPHRLARWIDVALNWGCWSGSDIDSVADAIAEHIHEENLAPEATADEIDARALRIAELVHPHIADLKD